MRSFLEVKKGYLQSVLAATVFSLREHEGENQRGGGWGHRLDQKVRVRLFFDKLFTQIKLSPVMLLREGPP